MRIKKLRAKLSTIRHFPSYTGIMLPDKEIFRNFYNFLSTSLNKKEFQYRKSLLSKINAEETSYEIKDDDGYLIADMSENENMKSALKYAREIVNSIDWEERRLSAKKYFLIEHKLDLLDPVNDPILKLATSPDILKPVSKYLGTFPILGAAAVWYSPNKEIEPIGSQLYHIDGEAIKQIKLFIPIEEITDDCGPFTFLPAKLSGKICNAFLKDGTIFQRNVKLQDEKIYSMADQNEVRKLTGKPGTAGFVDTCRCYHYGSRAANKPRIMLHLHYYSAFCKMMPLWGREDKIVSAENEKEYDPEIIQALLGKSHLTFTNVRTKPIKKKSA